MKRVLCLLLSLLLLLFGCGPAEPVTRNYLRMNYARGSVHGHTAFSDMVLSYPDPDAVIQSIDQALEQTYGVTVEMQIFADEYPDQLKLAFESGPPPGQGRIHVPS